MSSPLTQAYLEQNIPTWVSTHVDSDFGIVAFKVTDLDAAMAWLYEHNIRMAASRPDAREVIFHTDQTPKLGCSHRLHM